MSKPSRSEIEAILAGTKGVSPGPWSATIVQLGAANRSHKIAHVTSPEGIVAECVQGQARTYIDNSDYIARLDPQTVSALCTALLESMDRVERYEEALQWYAEQVAGCRKITSEGDTARKALDRDGGERARKSLGGSNER